MAPFCDFHVLILIEGLQRQSSGSWEKILQLLWLLEDKPRNTTLENSDIISHKTAVVMSVTNIREKLFCFHFIICFNRFFLEMNNELNTLYCSIHSSTVEAPYSKCDSFIGTG